MPFSWVLLIIVSIYFLYSKFFISDFRLPFHERQHRQQIRQHQKQLLPNGTLAVSPPHQRTDEKEQSMLSNQFNGIACVNAIIGLNSETIKNKANDWLLEAKPIPTVMESIKVTALDLAVEEPPLISALSCVQHTEEKTIIDAKFEYEGGFFIECVMRPRMLPLNLRCLLSEVIISGKLRISIEYFPIDQGSGISQVDVSLSEYPEIDSKLQMFDSLDFNAISSTIPSLTATLKKRFKESLMMYVYPNTYPLMTKNQSKGSNGEDKNVITIGNEMDDLEDAVKSTLLDVNQLLTNKDHNASSVKKEAICESVMQFLKFGKEKRIPVSMMETVKKGFHILNNLIFDEKTGRIHEPSFQVILQKDNMMFIGHVCQTCSLADELMRNIMKIRDDKLKKQVNDLLNELKLQDIPLTVYSRAR
ncbi:1 TM domain-containing transmembrane protein [Acrasis kona]|uniref:1 TM domain-containing transmembrane protein n=1 Tax=Acrasis kona TaxID=1008807 RepID=A0AAW2Z8U1_9EUKA